MTHEHHFSRHFDVMSVRDDGRTVEGRIVPYGEIADVVDIHPETGKLAKYREQFLPHSFTHAVQYSRARGNAGFIHLNLEHDETMQARIGYAKELDERDDGVYGIFRLYQSRDLEKTQSMLGESHTGLSVKFADVRPVKILNDVVSHVQVALMNVAATPQPAYRNAKVMALRGADDDDTEMAQLDLATPNLDDVRAWLASMKGASA